MDPWYVVHNPHDLARQYLSLYDRYDASERNAPISRAWGNWTLTMKAKVVTSIAAPVVTGAVIGGGIGFAAGGPPGLGIGAGVGAGVGLLLSSATVKITVHCSSLNHRKLDGFVGKIWEVVAGILEDNDPDLRQVACAISYEIPRDPVKLEGGKAFYERSALMRGLDEESVNKRRGPLGERSYTREAITSADDLFLPVAQKLQEICQMHLLSLQEVNYDDARKNTKLTHVRRCLEQLRDSIADESVFRFRALSNTLSREVARGNIKGGDYLRKIVEISQWLPTEPSSGNHPGFLETQAKLRHQN
ncbi:MAG: hypothetical protein WB791_07665 [Waddliaceae bacterium]